MNSTARGLTRPDGREPALYASTRPAPCMRAKASAIWLRLLFSTQTNTTRFRAGSVMENSSVEVITCRLLVPLVSPLASAALDGVDLNTGGVLVHVVPPQQLRQLGVNSRRPSATAGGRRHRRRATTRLVLYLGVSVQV